MNIRFCREWKFAEAVVEPCRVVAGEGGTVTGESKFSVDDIVSTHGGRSIRIIRFHVFETSLENVGHISRESSSSNETTASLIVFLITEITDVTLFIRAV